jgi:3' terminal RNA ribose 2'-O-methyltransferase Hen1
MLLTLTTTHQPATDLGFLLHKNPARSQVEELSMGKAHVFYPEASRERCTAALLLEIDPVALVRNRKGPGGDAGTLREYVNDRPYVASSFLSVAISKVFGSALGGRSKDRPELAATPIPLQATIAVLPCRGGEPLLRRLFEPLGHSVTPVGHPLDEKFPDWGESQYFTVMLEATCRLSDLLRHIYVLVPVLDREKHYWITQDEVEKLLRHGTDWLAGHPERELIVDRYLKHQRRLARAALERLIEEDEEDPEVVIPTREAIAEDAEANLSLREQRIGSMMAVLKGSGARRVLDLGCGEGPLLKGLLADPQFLEIVGMDVSVRALENAHERLDIDRLPRLQAERIKLLHGSLMYRDPRLEGYDAAAVMEVVEHLDPPRLAAFERVVFRFARPGTVAVTTPNIEYNARYPNLAAGKLRHPDHRFEWTRGQFHEWSGRIAKDHGYMVRFLPVGGEDPEVGSPTQMAVFTR